MNKVRITKEFKFEAAHALMGYDGPCKNVHGHSYELSVTVIGTPNSDPESPKLGMVMDFGDLKKIIKNQIIDKFDHAFLVNAQQSNPETIPSGEPFTNLVCLPYQPTSENFLIDFSQQIKQLLPCGVALHSLKLRETNSSYAEWYASDNE